MALLSRTDQFRLVTEFENDYGIVTSSEYGVALTTHTLAKEISHIAQPRYFDEDMLSTLHAMLEALQHQCGNPTIQ